MSLQSHHTSAYGSSSTGVFKVWLHKWSKLITLTILVSLFALGIKTGFHTFLHRSQYTSSITNTMCSTTDSAKLMIPLMKRKNNRTDVHQVFKNPLNTMLSLEDVLLLKQKKQKNTAANFDADSLCDMPEQMQFKKFIWFLTDGLPVKYSTKTINLYKDHAILYTVDIKGPKYSHAIYTSYLTGQLPTNYQGRPIEGDSLLKSMQRSPDIGPLTYIGPEWSFLAIQGKNNYNQLFRRTLIKPEPLDQPHDRAYRFFFKDQPAKDWLGKILDFIQNEKGSLLTHSAIFDHVNHGVYRNNPSPQSLKRLDQVGGRIADDLNTLKAYIDKHPDTLLILSSDHGCDDVSNGYVLHGHSTNGNEGYVMLYNPRLKPGKQRIDVVDVAPTIAKYLSKVDIPSDNIGVARTYYGDDEASIQYQNNVLKQNILQMADTSMRRGVKINRDTIHNMLKMKFDQVSRNPRDFNRLLLQTATGLKMNLYKLLDRPFGWVAYYGVQSLIVLLIILYRYNYNLLVMVTKLQIFKSLKMSMLFTPMYFGIFINVLFIWDGWKNIIRSGGPFYIWHGYLALVVFYLLVRTMRASSEDTMREELLDVSKRFLIHTCLNMTWFGFFTMFKKEWKRWMDSKYIFYGPYAGIVLLIFMTSNIDLFNMVSKPIAFIVRKLRKNQQYTSPHSPVVEDPAAQPKERPNYTHLILSLMMFASLILFEMTSVKETASREEKAKYISYYSMYGFHKYYAAFLPLIFLYFASTLILNTRNLDRLLVPSLLYAFAIMRDTPHGRVLLVVTCLQYYLLLVPALQKVAILGADYRRQVESKATASATNEKTFTQIFLLESSHAWELLQQALVLFMVNEPMFHFVVGKEEKLNVDAHPMAGATGMRSHQEYPSFNAFQMAFEKWHPMLIFAIFLWTVVHKMSLTQARQSTQKQRSPTQSEPQQQEQVKSYFANLILSICCLLLFNANAFLQLLLCFISMSHPFEDSVVYLIVMGVNGCAFTLFHTLTEYLVIGSYLRRMLLAWIHPNDYRNIVVVNKKPYLGEENQTDLISVGGTLLPMRTSTPPHEQAPAVSYSPIHTSTANRTSLSSRSSNKLDQQIGSDYDARV